MKNLVIATSLLLLSAGPSLAQDDDSFVNWAPSLHEVVAVTIEASPDLSSSEEPDEEPPATEQPPPPNSTESEAYLSLLNLTELYDPPTLFQLATVTAAVAVIAEGNTFTLFSSHLNDDSDLADYFDRYGIGVGNGDTRGITTGCNCNESIHCQVGYVCDRFADCQGNGSAAEGVCRQVQ